MAALLVSVRSAEEALAALAGGADIIDVKEPDRGPLGRAEVEVWRSVRRVVPAQNPVTVALGELADWRDEMAPTAADFEGIALRKIGPAGTPRGWAAAWARALVDGGGRPPWVAVAYADWEAARAPHPSEIIEAALASADCPGVLVDTWEKGRANPLDGSWRPLLRRVREAGKFVALAGGLDVAAMARLAPLEPDIFAVRGAACGRGERRGTIVVDRVAALANAAKLASSAGGHLP